MAQEFYNIEVPGQHLYDLKEPIQIRKITPIEQKQLVSLLAKISDDSNSTDDINNSKLMIQYINKLITGIDPMELYWPDYYFLLYQMRLVTYKMFPLEGYFECPECGNKQKVTIDISKLDILEVPEIYTKDKKVFLENFGEVPFRFKKVKDDLTANEFMKAKNLDLNDLNLKSLIYDLLFLSEWKSLDELWELTENNDITMQDIIVIEDLVSKCAWGVQEEFMFNCEKCHKSSKTPYTMQLDNFFPSNFN